MKIAVIDPSLFTWPYDHALVEGLRDNGHTVSLFTKHLADEEPGKNASEIVEFFYPGLHSVWAQKLPSPVLSMLKGLMHPVCLVSLLRRLRRMRPDVIHFQSAPLPAVDGIFIPAFRRIAPTILTVHDSAPFNSDPRSIVQRIGVISIMKSFDRLIVHTNRARQRLISYGLPPAKVAIIPHGILDGVLTLPLVLPPTVAGFFLLLVFRQLLDQRGERVHDTADLAAIAVLGDDVPLGLGIA